MLIDYYWTHFDWRTTIGSLVLISCTSICATVWRDILFISWVLGLEDTWTEAENAWVFVVNLVGMMGSSFVFTNISLMMFPADTLKMSHDSTKTEFMWQGKNFFYHTSSFTLNSPHYRETTFCHLGHYHWAGCWQSFLLSRQTILFFGAPYA